MNQLEGSVNSIDLKLLPSTLTHLYLSRYKFVGPIDLTNLPMSLKHLYLEHNNIQQNIVEIGVISENLEYIDLSGNSIGSVVDLDGNIVKDDRIYL